MTPICCVFDIDGVVIRGRSKDNLLWTTDLQDDLGINPDLLVQHFFEKRFAEVLKGKRPLNETLHEAMTEIGQPEKTQALIDYWLKHDDGIDSKLLDYLNRKRESCDLHLVLATNQEHTRAKYIWDNLDLKAYFDQLIYSAASGYLKSEEAFFENLEVSLATKEYQKRLYIDDDARNIAIAEKKGWECHLFVDTDTLLDWLNARLRC